MAVEEQQEKGSRRFDIARLLVPSGTLHNALNKAWSGHWKGRKEVSGQGLSPLRGPSAATFGSLKPFHSQKSPPTSSVKFGVGVGGAAAGAPGGQPTADVKHQRGREGGVMSPLQLRANPRGYKV